MGDIGLAAGLAVQRFVPCQARRRHAHTGDADAVQATRRDDDGVHLVADIHDTRRFVAKTVGQAGKDIAALHNVRIRGNRFHGSPPRTMDVNGLRPSCQLRLGCAGFRTLSRTRTNVKALAA